MNDSQLTKARHFQVDVAPDHLQHIARCHPLLGIAELIWNALDADSTEVKIWLREGALGGIDRIQVIDNGEGIDITRVESAFRTLGLSWKRAKKTTGSGRSLHGQAGRGRFRACTLGRVCVWDTTNQAPTKDLYSYSVTIDTDRIKDVETTRPAAVPQNTPTGTTVTVSEIRTPRSRLFKEDAIRDYLTEHFGHYLLNYPRVTISINGGSIDPTTLIANQSQVALPAVDLPDGTTTSVRIRIVEWKRSGDRRIFLCDSDGMTIAEVPMRSHLLDDTVSAYVYSPYLITSNVRDVANDQIDQVEEAKPILAVVRNQVKAYLQERQAAKAHEAVERWKERTIYPYQEDPQNAVELAERNLFNMLADQVDRHLPSFSKAATSVQRSHFLLLRHAMESQPDGLVQLVAGFTNLPAAERARLESVLTQTPLANIIKGTRLVQERLAVLAGLEELLNNPKLRKQFAERKHLHEIVSRNVWIFGEEFNLTTSDLGLSTSVRRHIEQMGAAIEVDPDFQVLNGRKRVDLMLTRAMGAYGRTREHLIVELKRPTEKGGLAILNQMSQYAFAMAEDPQWNSVTRWTFWGVVHELDDYGRAKTNVKERPPGLADTFSNSTIWLKTWSEVIADARGRLEFLRSAFEMQTTNQQGLDHLAEAYRSATPREIHSKRLKVGAQKTITAVRTRAQRPLRNPPTGTSARVPGRPR